MKYIGSLLTLTLILLALTSIIQGQCNNNGDERPPSPPPAHTNIVLVGATGDLAKKYLWNGRLQQRNRGSFFLTAINVVIIEVMQSIFISTWFNVFL